MAKDAPNVGAKTKPAKAPKSDESGKAEVKAGAFMLKLGHPTPYRRTVTLDGSTKANKPVSSEAEKVQLEFQPGQAYDLSDIEAEGCRDLIENGFLVPARTDEKGRNKPVQVSSPRTDADGTIDKLEKKVEELAAENAELKAQLKNAPKVTLPAQVEQKP